MILWIWVIWCVIFFFSPDWTDFIFCRMLLNQPMQTLVPTSSVTSQPSQCNMGISQTMWEVFKSAWTHTYWTHTQLSELITVHSLLTDTPWSSRSSPPRSPCHRSTATPSSCPLQSSRPPLCFHTTVSFRSSPSQPTTLSLRPLSTPCSYSSHSSSFRYDETAR